MKRDVFEATDELAHELLRLIDLPLSDGSHRLAVSDVACSISLEHWAATRSLLKIGVLLSAVVVHRAQFESLLRSLWILYIASDEQVSKLAAELTVETEQSAKNLPGVAVMMSALSKEGPPQAYGGPGVRSCFLNFDAVNRVASAPIKS